MLALEHEFALTHGGTVALIVVGNVLYGVAAPFAGWLGDRWSTTGMVALFFLGTGAGMVATGLAGSLFEIGLGLAVTGLFASIYHPVGIAWLVRNARSWGKELGINGVFGGLGPAAASLTAGTLIDLAGWRAAFIVPGLIVLATGFAFCVLRWRGLIVETRVDRRPPPESGHGDMVRAFLVLSLTMLCSGLIYQATQPALPKLFAERIDTLVRDGVLGVSMLVAFVYVVSGGLQVLAGHLAHRFQMKLVYVVC
ncbi:MAG: MFS transporter, partial [Hyphomicrobiales bacterium]